MKKERGYIGIDPGQTGAMALISNEHIDIMDFNCAFQIAEQLSEWKADYDIVAYLEKVHSMPKQGVASTFKFGVNFGIWRGILTALNIPFFLVTPQNWQSHFFTRGDTKKKSLAAARSLYPKIAKTHLKRMKDHNRADALLIATFGTGFNVRV